MRTAERLGMLGALATAVTVPFALRARREARQETEREEAAQLCASRLQTLADALRAYRQDHGGELPRKFICPPGDRRLAKGWSADWNEASLANYVTDADVYSCPCDGAYYDRVPLLLRDGPRQLMRPEPQSVVMYCRQHARPGGERRWVGEFIVLRLDGSVERVPASEVDSWQYGDGRWYAPDEEASEGTNVFSVFPGEPWPPRLEAAPDRPWCLGDLKSVS